MPTGFSGHCLDYEIQGFPPTHGTSSCLPAALALAELHHVPGSRVITAYVLGWEIQGRLRAASAPATAPGYHPPGLVGPLGGAAAAAKTVGLDADQTLMALGIAASRTGGLTANTGTMVKSTHPGNAARMGAEAAILAGMGYTASDEVLESPVGYAAAIFGGDFNWDVATGGLGASWRLVDPGFDIKRFPAQVYMQNAIEAALNLREQNGVDPNNIEQVTIRRRGRGHSGPVPAQWSRRQVQRGVLRGGRPAGRTGGYRHFHRRPPLLPGHGGDAGSHLGGAGGGPESGATLATAALKDGTTVSAECSAFTGSASNPMSRELLLAKARDCFIRALSDADTERVLEMLENLERLDDTADLMSVLGNVAVGRA